MSKNRRPRKQRDIRKTPTSSPGKRSSPSVVSDSSAIRDLPELGEARAFWVQNRIAEALWRFDRIVSKHPDNVLALVDASRAFGAMYQYRRAESLLARLEELGHGRPEILHLAAQTYRLIRRPQKARELFQKVISLSESSVDSHLELALLCERQCEWDRAWDHILARLRYLPNDQEGRLVQGRLAMQRAEWETAERALRGVTRDAKAHWLTRSRAYVELARLLDVRGDFNSAWDAIWQAKSLARPQARPALDHRNRILPSLLSLIRDCSAQDYSRWASITKDQSSASSGPSQSVLLTGIPRSGTTLLEQILGAHSDIVVADEWDVFPRIVLPRLFKTTTIDGLRVDHLDQLSDEQLSRKRNLYTRCLAAGLGRSLRGAVVVDKNPSLLPLLPIYKRLFPQSKIIVALRDPRDILISCLLTHFPLNDFSVDFLSLETAARRVVQELESWLVLRERLPADWVECRYEDLVYDLPETVTKVLDRIGLRWQEPLGRHHEVAASPIFSPGFERANLAVDTRAVGRWRHYSHQIAPVLHHFDRILPQLGYDGPMGAR